MIEPSWDGLREQLMGMTMRELRGIGRRWFNGSLGGASTKVAVTNEMVGQMRHWWNMPDGYGRDRVRNVIADVNEVWREGRDAE